MAYDKLFWQNYYSTKSIDTYLQMYSEKQFTERLLYIMKKNNIRKIDISRAIGVNEQTVRNWFDTKNGYQPQWLTYMFKLFIFLESRCRNFNIMHLFLIEYNEKVLEKTEEIMQNINNKVTYLRNKDIWSFYAKVLSSHEIENQLKQLKELSISNNGRYYEMLDKKKMCKNAILNEIRELLELI